MKRAHARSVRPHRHGTSHAIVGTMASSLDTLARRTSNLLLPLALMGLAAGCRSQAIDQAERNELAQIDKNVENNVLTPSCPDGSRLGPNCGLIAKAMGSDRFRKRFRAAYCEDIDDQSCESLYERMFRANLTKRYGGADFDRVALECDAAPRSCEDPADYERQLLASHNETVIAGGVRRRVEATKRWKRRQDEHIEGQLRAVQKIGSLLGRRRRCRSYPSVFGGVTTVCTERQ